MNVPDTRTLLREAPPQPLLPSKAPSFSPHSGGYPTPYGSRRLSSTVGEGKIIAPMSCSVRFPVIVVDEAMAEKFAVPFSCGWGLMEHAVKRNRGEGGYTQRQGGGGRTEVFVAVTKMLNLLRTHAVLLDITCGYVKNV